jgi:outer membrane protein assembly factor BamB
MKKYVLSIGLFLMLIFITLSPIVLGIQINNHHVLYTIIQEQTEKLKASPMDSAWPMFCHDTRHTGRSSYGKVGNFRALRWKYKIPNADPLIKSSPAIDKNGTIYLGFLPAKSVDTFYAINPNGTKKWSYDCDWVQSSPAIANDGTIYVGSDTGFLHAFSPNGTRKWRVRICHGWVYSSPVIDENGTIYVAGVNGRNIVAVYPNGTKKWSYYTNDYIYDSPAIDKNGILYCGSNDGFLYAIFKGNGTLKWKYKTKLDANSPTISDDGIIYLCSNDHYLRALYPNGTLKWKFSVGFDALTSSPALGNDGNIYFGCHAGYIYSLNSSTGEENWRYPTEAEVSGPISIDGNGIIYGSDWDGNFYALNPDGTARWKFKTNKSILTSPVIGEDGTIFIGSWTGYLYALEIIEIDNEPPLKPSLEGPTEGKARKPLTFNSTATDPDGDNISYFFDWEYEYENSGWLDFVPSGTSISIEQTFYIVGTYTVKVKAQDEYGAESPWETMEIKITKKRTRASSYHWLIDRFPLLERLLFFIGFNI